MVTPLMFIIIIATLAATTPPAAFNVTEWRVTAARNAWLECVVQNAAYIRSAKGDPLPPGPAIALAESQCWVMRYAVRDALPDLVRADLIAQGVNNPQLDVVDKLADATLRGIEADMHKLAVASQR